MALRNIRKEGDSILTKTARVVENFDDRLLQLLGDMADTMYDAKGVGLAAPQVGVLRRVAVIDVGDGLLELINPEIIESSGEQREPEGCLSCPNQGGITLRPAKVKVKAQNKEGTEFTIESSDLKARALCHEIDHLNGILFKQRLIEKVDSSKE